MTYITTLTDYGRIQKDAAVVQQRIIKLVVTSRARSVYDLGNVLPALPQRCVLMSSAKGHSAGRYITFYGGSILQFCGCGLAGASGRLTDTCHFATPSSSMTYHRPPPGPTMWLNSPRISPLFWVYPRHPKGLEPGLS